MKRRALGSTGLQVSEIGFGAWQLGGSGWGRFRGDDAVNAVLRALDLGINLFDTAPVYGFGRSEELLSKALGKDRTSVVIVSKGGLVWDERGRVAHDNRPEALRRGLEGTLRRLRRDDLDILLLHWPDPAVRFEESASALESFREEGKIKLWGVANFPAAQVLSTSRTERGGRVFQYPMNILEEYAEEYRASAEAGRELMGRPELEGSGFLAFDVLARGLLGGSYGPGTRFGKRDLRSRDARFQGEAFERNIARLEALKAQARLLGLSLARFSVRRVLDQPRVTAAIIGMKTKAQVEDVAGKSG
jgi:aryl-alcohol dehydrogenase-like predicted oxidoreductase